MGDCVKDVGQCNNPANDCKWPHKQWCSDGTCRSTCPVWKARPDPKDYSVADDCEAGFFRCSTGSCKASPSQCDIVVACPMSLPYRCSSGQCVKTQEECLDVSMCPVEKPFHCVDGVCRPTCKGLRYNGCGIGYYKCPLGECVTKKEECTKCQKPLPPGLIHPPTSYQCGNANFTKPAYRNLDSAAIARIKEGVKVSSDNPTSVEAWVMRPGRYAIILEPAAMKAVLPKTWPWFVWAAAGFFALSLWFMLGLALYTFSRFRAKFDIANQAYIKQLKKTLMELKNVAHEDEVSKVK